MSAHFFWRANNNLQWNNIDKQVHKCNRQNKGTVVMLITVRKYKLGENLFTERHLK